MSKLIGILLVAGALAAGVAWVPLGGRTVRERWHAARSPEEFARRSLRELSVAAGLSDAPAKPARQGHAAAPPKAPVERHSDSDRAALERVVAERAGK